MCVSNLIQIEIHQQQQDDIVNQPMPKHSVHKGDTPLTYTLDSLKHIKATTHYDIRYKHLDHQTCCTIQQLRLNRRGKRGGKNNKKITKQQGTDHRNIILIHICDTNTKTHPSENVEISSINIQTIKNKEYVLHEYIVNNTIDACVILETWLKNNDEDKVWVAILNRDGNKISMANRSAKTGRGLVLDITIS